MKEITSATGFARMIVRESLEKEIPEISQAIKTAMKKRSPIIEMKVPISPTARLIFEKKGYEIIDNNKISCTKEWERIINDPTEIEKILEDIRSSEVKRSQMKKINES